MMKLSDNSNIPVRLFPGWAFSINNTSARLGLKPCYDNSIDEAMSMSIIYRDMFLDSMPIPDNKPGAS